jgi:RES domain
VPLAPDVYQPVEAGEKFWHVYNDPYDPRSFNPAARGRFAAHLASPPRAMLYAGDTADCALWETVLRTLVPEGGVCEVQVPPVHGVHLARLQLKERVKLLDLGRFGARWIAGKNQRLLDRLILLTTVPKYGDTHRMAVTLLEKYPNTQGLRWPSKQTGEDVALAFYQPPLSSAHFECLESTTLESPEGIAHIDRALSRAGLVRMDSAALAAEVARGIAEDTGPDV